MKKGQSEIIGLVIIVVLITLAMFFVISFTMKQEIKPKEYSDYELLAESTIVAILQATPDCHWDKKSSQIKDFLIAAAEEKTNYGSNSCWLVGGGSGYNTKTFINQTITDLLNQTLGIKKKKYLFISKVIGGKTIVNISNQFDLCQGDIFSSNPYPYPTAVGTLENTLSLCGS